MMLCLLQSIMGGWGTTYKFICQPVGSIEDKVAYRVSYSCELYLKLANQYFQMVNAHYVYFISKFVELLDTVSAKVIFALGARIILFNKARVLRLSFTHEAAPVYVSCVQ